MREHPVFAPLGRAGAVEYMVRTWVSECDGHAPHVAVVTEALHAQFAARAAAARASRGP